MRKTSALLLVAVSVAIARAQSPNSGAVVRLDPGANDLISPEAVVEKVKDGFGFVASPLWIRQGNSGYLLFGDIPSNVIHKWTPDGTLSIVLDHADFTDPSVIRPDKARFGANGLAVDREGRIVFAAEGDRAIVRIEKNGARTVLADRYEGKRLNSPNDLVLKSNGAIYFTDPSGGNRFTGWDLKKELPFQGVFLFKNGRLQLLVQDLDRPNGITLSPDEKHLYVNDSNKKIIMRYDVHGDDTIANGQVFVDATQEKAPGNPDGMRVDERGNVFSVGPGGIWIVSPAGKHLATIGLPEAAPGFGFGDADRKTLYIGANTTLYRIRLKVAGR